MRNAFRAGMVMKVLVVGCDSKSDEVKLGDFGQQSANAVCDKVYERGSLTDTELMAHMGYSGGRAARGTKNKDSMGFWAAVMGQEQERGRLAYDPKLAHRCLWAVAAASCEGHKSNQLLEGRVTFITPKTPAGLPCKASESCIGGSCIDSSPKSRVSARRTPPRTPRAPSEPAPRACVAMATSCACPSGRTARLAT